MMDNSNWEADVSMAVCVSKSLYQLSLHSTYFDGADGSNTATVAAASHHHEFQAFVGQIVEGIVSSSVMGTCATILADWLQYIQTSWTARAFELLPYLEVFMSNILAFIANVISKTDESAAVLRRHVAAETTLVPGAVIPYIMFALDLMERGGQNNIARSVKTVLLLLKLLSFMTHRVKLFRPIVKAHPHLIQRLLTQPVLWNSPYQLDFIALCVRLCINAELEEGTQFMEHVARTSLTTETRGKLAWRLTGPTDDMYPVNTLSDMYPRLESLFDESIAVADNQPSLGTAYTVTGDVRGEVQF
jgi:hypothetical protein